MSASCFLLLLTVFFLHLLEHHLDLISIPDPFRHQAGKATNERKAEVRIQFKEEILPFRAEAKRDELVMKLQPNEACPPASPP